MSSSKKDKKAAEDKKVVEDNNTLSDDDESTDLDSEMVSSDSDYYKNNNQLDDLLYGKDISINSFSPEEQKRYETFRRSNFTKGTVKKYISQVIGQAVNPNIIIAVSGLSKVFVGELVLKAKEVQAELNHKGALLPSHIDEAMRRISKTCPNMEVKKYPPWDQRL